jgi:gluconokinase
MIIVLMGASGAGKSTVGRALAVALGWDFVEADDFHPAGNVEKMRRGDELSDADRAPWLIAINAALAAADARRASVVVACSALKAQYRAMLSRGLPDVRFVYLKAGAELLRQRLATRTGHFAGPALVATQLATLQEPQDDALTIDAADPVDEIVAKIRREITSAIPD